MKIDVQVLNLETVLRRMAATQDVGPAAISQGLFRRGEEIMTDAKEHYVPVKTGVLRNSGYVEAPVLDGSEISVTVGFGGPAQAYATVQHEHLEFHHTVGQAKYLQIPALLAFGGEAQEKLAVELQQAIATAQAG